MTEFFFFLQGASLVYDVYTHSNRLIDSKSKFNLGNEKEKATFHPLPRLMWHVYCCQ